MLTPKRERFVAEYCLDHNAARAARAAGYSGRTARTSASLLLTFSDVKDAVVVREAESAKALNITRQGVITALREAFDLARGQRDPGAMIAACREIARCAGFYAPRVNVDTVHRGDNRCSAHFETMTDEQLVLMVEAGSQEIHS